MDRREVNKIKNHIEALNELPGAQGDYMHIAGFATVHIEDLLHALAEVMPHAGLVFKEEK